jgi:hypothetical protein
LWVFWGPPPPQKTHPQLREGLQHLNSIPRIFSYVKYYSAFVIKTASDYLSAKAPNEL